MRKILYIVSTLKKSGPTNQLSYIIKYLDKNKFEATILTLSPEPSNSMVQYFRNNLDVKIDSLKLSRIQGLLHGRSKIKQYVKDNDIDIIHTQGFRADGLIKNINIPKVSTLRNYPYYDYPSKFGKIKGSLMVSNHMSTIKSNQRNCIACAKTISKEFEQNDIKLSFIQNGVDTEQYTILSDNETSRLKDILNINRDKKIFITVGNLIPRKDMKTVINGFKLYNENNDSILLIAGDGFEMNKLKNISDDSIVFLGNILNVAEYLQVSDCFVSASLAEGLPNTVLEAMACGLPVVLSDIPSHLELFEKGKGNFFTIKNEYELSNLLKKISLNFKEQRELLLKIINENFSAKVMSEKYQEVYRKKINEPI